MKKASIIPKISIIIPIYIGTSQVEKTIKSALNQTYKNIEVVVVDGSYNSETKRAISKYKNRITYCKKQDDKESLIYTGLKKASGQYISILYESDRFLPKKIEKQASTLIDTKQAKIIPYSSYILKDSYNKIKRKVEHSQKQYKNKPELLFYKSYIYAPTMLIPIAIVNKVLGIKELKSILTSYEICLYALENGYNLLYQNDPKVIRNINAKTLFDPEHSDEVLDGLISRSLIRKNFSEKIFNVYGSEYSFWVQLRININSDDYPLTAKLIAERIHKHNERIIAQIKKTKSKVSVITPLYNRAKLIEEVLKSIEVQTFSDYSYVIIDDGSKDNSGEIVSKFIKDKDNWFYIYQENKGEAETVNFGWSITQGDYFVQVNSDDPVKKDLFKEMSSTLDKNKDCVLAYCDFDITDEKGKVKQVTKSPDYNFLRDLSEFSCYAASPGAFIRKSSFADLIKIKDGRYRHTNDIKMLWNMALRGNFIHVPKNLATWRSHEEGISSDRFMAIPEIEEWLRDFFNQDLSRDVLNVKSKCMESVYRYFVSLLKNSESSDKEELIHYYSQKIRVASTPYVNLQVGDNDLIGNKFNGHDIHIALRKKGVDSSHIVWNKDSTDPDTYLLAGDKHNRFEIKGFADLVQSIYDLDNVENPLIFDLMYNKLFIDSDVIHLHLMHNGLWDLNVLPVLSRLKPIVWTVHDMWIATGSEYAKDRPDYYFPLPKINNLDINWKFKSEAIKNSNVTFVVASKYMQKAVQDYKIFSDKEVVYIPFGLNFEIFYQREKLETRKELGLDSDEFIVLFRGDGGVRKGVHYVENVMQQLGIKHRIHFIVVGGKDVEVPPGVKHTWYGWVKDDELMAKLYSVSDLFLMPSTRENFGMMAIESMACGTVPVVIDGTALPETVDAPDCGVSTPPQIPLYTKAVENLLLNPKELKTRSAKGIKYVRQNHSMDQYVNSLDNLYKRKIREFESQDQSYKDLLTNIRLFNQTIPTTSIKNIHVYNKPKKLIPRTKYQYTRLRGSINSRGLTPTVKIIASRGYGKIKKKL